MNDVAAFDNVWAFAVPDAIKAGITLFFNGIYLLLVIFALYFLRHRGPAGHRVLILTIAIMFIFAMVQMTLQIVTATLSMRSLYAVVHGDGTISSGQLQSKPMYLILGFLEDLLLVTNNTITDSLLIYRCYVIWGTSCYKKKVVILPLVLLLSTTVLGYVTVSRNDLGPPQAHFDSRIVFGLAFTTNLILTGLTVGRLWWTRRHLRTIGQTKFIQRYNLAMTMLLESSALYFICFSILLVVLSLPNSRNSETGSPVAYVCYGFGGQLMNIVPALVIVQVNFSRKTGIEPNVSHLKPSHA